jgi:nucleoredoxin
MRRLVGLITLLLSSLVTTFAAPLPLTVKDVSLMLRSGYSSQDIMQDLAKRRFSGALDAAGETQLIQAGAKPDLISAIKTGTYVLSPAEAARAKKEAEAQAQRRALQAAEDQKYSTLYREKLARDREAQAQNAQAPDAVAKYLQGDLVRYYNGNVVAADINALANKKLIAFYFSAHWCAPCRKFTPKLVEYYNRAASQHPEFEVVLFSFDKSSSAMQSYMSETKMPWLAIDYQKLSQKAVLKTNAGDGIPSLVLVDSTGKVLSTSYENGEYLGPQKVLADIDAIFAGGKIGPVAARN